MLTKSWLTGTMFEPVIMLILLMSSEELARCGECYTLLQTLAGDHTGFLVLFKR